MVNKKIINFGDEKVELDFKWDTSNLVRLLPFISDIKRDNEGKIKKIIYCNGLEKEILYNSRNLPHSIRVNDYIESMEYDDLGRISHIHSNFTKFKNSILLPEEEENFSYYGRRLKVQPSKIRSDRNDFGQLILENVEYEEENSQKLNLLEDKRVVYKNSKKQCH